MLNIYAQRIYLNNFFSVKFLQKENKIPSRNLNFVKSKLIGWKNTSRTYKKNCHRNSFGAYHLLIKFDYWNLSAAVQRYPLSRLIRATSCPTSKISERVVLLNNRPSSVRELFTSWGHLPTKIHEVERKFPFTYLHCSTV